MGDMLVVAPTLGHASHSSLLPPVCAQHPDPFRRSPPTCPPPCRACLLLHGVTQLASLLAWSSLPGSERFQRVLSIFVCLGLFLMPFFAPAWYNRRRQAVLTGFRWVLGAGYLRPLGCGRAAPEQPPCCTFQVPSSCSALPPCRCVRSALDSTPAHTHAPAAQVHLLRLPAAAQGAGHSKGAGRCAPAGGAGARQRCAQADVG